jgi:Mrp family chromosome partitioning ATPase
MSRVHDALSRARATGDGSETTPAATPAGVPMFPAEGQEAGQAWSSEAPPVEDIVVSDAYDPPDVSASADLQHVLEAPRRHLGEKIVLGEDPDHNSVEQYRRLAARLHLAQAEHGIKVVMIASALPGEGKTLTATNLALTLSESYQRDVLLIDGDLRRPSIHEMFQVPNVSGLNDGLRSEANRKVPLVRWSDRLTLITAGRPDPDPMKVLVSQKMKKVITEAAT